MALPALKPLCAVLPADLQAQLIISSLDSCPDYHPSLVAPMCLIAIKSGKPEVIQAAIKAAVQALISSTAVSLLPPGRESELLCSYVEAIDACLRSTPQPPAAATAALYRDLEAAVKLAARRLQALGWDSFSNAATSSGGAKVRDS